MLKHSVLKTLQETFLRTINSSLNPAEVTFKTHVINSGEDVMANFLGEGTETNQESLPIKCFYSYDIDKKDRESGGIRANSELYIIVATKHANEKNAHWLLLPEFENSKASIRATFLNKKFEILDIDKLEPVQTQNGLYYIAVKLFLRESKSQNNG